MSVVQRLIVLLLTRTQTNHFIPRALKNPKSLNLDPLAPNLTLNNANLTLHHEISMETFIEAVEAYSPL